MDVAKLTRGTLATATIVALSACGSGGSGPQPNTVPATAATPPAARSFANAVFHISVPASATSAKVRPDYVSAKTTQVSISVNGGVAVVAPLLPTGANCTPGTGGAYSCTVTVAAPVGADTFTISLLDASNNVLSTVAIPETIVLGVANQFNVTLNGVIGQISLTLSNPAPPANGTTQTIALTVTARDPAGQVIIGPGNYTNAISVSNTDTSGVTKMSIGGGAAANPVSILAPGNNVTIAYTGAPLAGGATFTASSTSVTNASITLSPQPLSITLNPATIALTAAGQSANVAVSESGYSGAFSQTNTCTGIATIVASSGGFTVTASAAGACTATIKDTLANTAMLNITVTTTGFTVDGRH